MTKPKTEIRFDIGNYRYKMKTSLKQRLRISKDVLYGKREFDVVTMDALLSDAHELEYIKHKIDGLKTMEKLKTHILLALFGIFVIETVLLAALISHG